MRLEKIFIYSVFLLLLFVTWGQISPALASGQKIAYQSVLVLHSYHPQLSWDRSIDKGIHTYFEKNRPDVELRFEYMDTKRITDSAYTRLLYELYRYKFKNVKFDAIICADNNGLDFLLKYHDILFPGTPVVFCGINNFSDDMIAGQKLFTGTVEAVSIEETIAVAMKLQPKTQQIVIYGDNSRTYHANKALAEKVADYYKPGVAFHFIDNIPVEQIQEHLKTLDKNSLILLMTTLRKEDGTLLSFEKSSSLLEKLSSLPIYGLWDFYIGHGIVGGKLTSGVVQGKTASAIASRILGGEAVTDIPLVRTSPNQYMFDNNQLEKFHLDPSRLPAGSLIINKKRSYFAENLPLILSGMGIVAVLILINTLMGLNIRRRKRAENSVLANEKRYRNLLESTSTVPWELDVNSGNFSYMGKQIEQILGYAAESWANMDSWASRIYPEDKEEAVEFCAMETSKGQDHDFVYRAVHKDGSQRWIRDIVSVVTNDDGSKKLIGFMHDITKQKKLSLEKEKLETRLVQAQKMEAIGTLAGGIAHDFNNILAAMLGYTELAREDCPPGSTVERDLANVMKAGSRAKHLVKRILAFSREDVTKRILLHPGEIVTETMKILRPSIPTTIEIRQNIVGDTSPVLADPTQVHQILMNLCTNAFHAMEKNGGTLEVRLKEVNLGSKDLVHEPDIDDGAFVQLSVCDSGSGIEDGIRGQIFDPYFTTKEFGKGTGMGLSIIHGILKSYGGFISCFSEPGKGSDFHVFFPVAAGTVQTETIDVEPLSTGGKRVLFVDDEKILVEMGKDMLERLGCHVTVSTRSLDALQIFQNHPEQFDLIITDQTMPHMTGAEMASAMIKIRADIPIILCTGYSSIISEEEAIAMGIKEFALKPLLKKDLSRLIPKVLHT